MKARSRPQARVKVCNSGLEHGLCDSTLGSVAMGVRDERREEKESVATLAWLQ